VLLDHTAIRPVKSKNKELYVRMHNTNQSLSPDVSLEYRDELYNNGV